jgi:uncharacterized protein YjbJ (UPF0337 family)
MNMFNLKGGWNTLAGRLKQRLARLTHHDALMKEGKEEEQKGELQKKIGSTKQALKKLASKL